MPQRLPSGRYLSASGVVGANKGGQTRAMLMRSRVIGAETGSPVDVLCFDPSPHYDGVRADLYATGQLAPDMRLLNMYEHFRDSAWRDAGTGAFIEAPDNLTPHETFHPDGTPWKTAYRDGSGKAVLNDYQRRDGSVYLRAAPYSTLTPETHPHEILRVAPGGDVVGRFDSLGAMYRRFIADITAEDERTFLFLDSRYLVPIIAPVDDPNLHVIYLLHNCHVPKPRAWNTPPLQDYRRCLEGIQDVDAFVTLTQRQREDIELRWGPRSNMGVVPNPVELPDPPEPVPVRDPHRVVTVARLERQKRLGHAVLIMDRVVKHVPDARLDIYGSGSEQQRLSDLIKERGLEDNVILQGHHPAARDALWEASAFLLTSEFEGYPLATLESLGRGCPVVSYDIRYGPREQITDGVEGYLIADGNIAQAAAQLRSLLSSTDRVAAMGSAGREAASQHGMDAFVEDWAAVLGGVLDRAPRRTRLRQVNLRLQLRPRVSRYLPSTLHRGFQVTGTLDVEATTLAADPTAAVLQLVAVDEATGAWCALPMTVIREGLRLDFSARVRRRDIFRQLPSSGGVYLQLRFTWENSYWSQTMGAEHLDPAAHVEQAEDGTIRLRPRRPTRAAAKSLWRRRVPLPVRAKVSRLRRRLSRSSQS